MNVTHSHTHVPVNEISTHCVAQTQQSIIVGRVPPFSNTYNYAITKINVVHECCRVTRLDTCNSNSIITTFWHGLSCLLKFIFQATVKQTTFVSVFQATI